MRKLLGVLLLCSLSMPVTGCDKIRQYVRAWWYGQPLLNAIHHGNVNHATWYLDHGAYVNTRTSDNRCTALHIAIREDRDETVTLLLDRGADVQSRDCWGRTSLHYAVGKRREDIVRQLLEQGADAKQQDSDGETALHHAVAIGDVGMVRLLLDYGADINNNAGSEAPWEGLLDRMFFHVPNGATPLHVAVRCGDHEMINLLLEHKADMHREDREGETPLGLAHFLMRTGMDEGVYELLDRYRCMHSKVKGIVEAKEHTQRVRRVFDESRGSR